MFENPFKKKNLKETIPLVTVEADPTTFSSLPPQKFEVVGAAEHYGGNKIATDGRERWYEIYKSPETQQIIARILKGIVNVSDVVRDEHTGKFYSQEMPIGKIEEMSPPAEVVADIALLALVFKDTDHWVKSAEDVNNSTSSPHLLSESAENRMLHNIRYENGRSVYFDFDESKDNLFFDNALSTSSTNAVLESQTDESREILNQKLSALKERLEGPEGKIFIENIVTRTGKQIFDADSSHFPDALFTRPLSMENVRPEDSIEFFRETLLNRITQVREMIQKDSSASVKTE